MPTGIGALPLVLRSGQGAAPRSGPSLLSLPSRGVLTIDKIVGEAAGPLDSDRVRTRGRSNYAIV